MSKTGLWHLHTIEVYKFGLIYPFELKIPAHMKSCVGVAFSVLEALDNPTKEDPHMGRISMQFNGQRVHPINILVGYKHNYKRNFLELLDV